VPLGCGACAGSGTPMTTICATPRLLIDQGDRADGRLREHASNAIWVDSPAGSLVTMWALLSGPGMVIS
jgi:hypothetical protein